MTKKTDTKIVIDLDIGSFNRLERRTMQDRFGHNFQTLRRYAGLAAGLTRPAEMLKNEQGEPIYADDVLIAFLHIARLRTEPNAQESDLDGYGIEDLIDAIDRPKGATTST